MSLADFYLKPFKEEIKINEGIYQNVSIPRYKIILFDKTKHDRSSASTIKVIDVLIEMSKIWTFKVVD